MIASKYQKAIYDEYRDTHNNILCGAVAGSGKTTTLLELLKQAHGSIYFLAFNKSIVQELEKRAPINHNIRILTMHSLGMRSLVSKFGKMTLRERKTYGFIVQMERKWRVPWKEKGLHHLIVEKLTDLYRLNMCTGPDELIQAATLIGVDFLDQHIDHTLDVIKKLERYNRRPEAIDFTDMIYLPATSTRFPLPTPDVTFIDEAQDLNKAQHAIIDRLTNNGSRRFVAVGDPHQSIYGFAGADTKSFHRFLDKPNTVQLPLSVCYRCPTRVIDHANQVYDIMEPFDENRIGEVRRGDVNEAEEGDMIICRNVKPLIELFFHYISLGKKAYVKGKDLGENLIQLLEPYKRGDFNELKEGLKGEKLKLYNELRSKGHPNPLKSERYGNLVEKIGAILIIIKHYDSVKDTIKGLRKIFSDSGTGIVLSTIHKAKGLEADNVFILNRSLIPSSYATTPEQFEQEKNLLYVAITRAKKKLIYIEI